MTSLVFALMVLSAGIDELLVEGRGMRSSDFVRYLHISISSAH